MQISPKKLPTLLLVSGNPLIRLFFEETVSKLKDHSLLVSASKEDALDLLSRTYISFIIIDEKTPNLDLTDLCKEIRCLKDHFYTPILVITTHLKKSFIRNIIKAGATDFLCEPLDEDEFHLRMEVAHDLVQTEAKIATLSSYVSRMAPPKIELENRVIVDSRATRLVEKALMEGTDLVLLLLQVDQYPQILEIQGENVAHALTLDFEDHLHNLIRKQDLLTNQNQGRYAVFLPKTSFKASVIIAGNLHKELDTEIFSAGNLRFVVTVSIGIASLCQSGDKTKLPSTNLERLYRDAALRLSVASKQGNQIVSESSQQEDES